MPYQKVAHHHKKVCLLIDMDGMWVKGIATDCWQDGVCSDNRKRYKLIRARFKVVVASCVLGCDFG